MTLTFNSAIEVNGISSAFDVDVVAVDAAGTVSWACDRCGAHRAQAPALCEHCGAHGWQTEHELMSACVRIARSILDAPSGSEHEPSALADRVARARAAVAAQVNVYNSDMRDIVRRRGTTLSTLNRLRVSLRTPGQPPTRLRATSVLDRAFFTKNIKNEMLSALYSAVFNFLTENSDGEPLYLDVVRYTRTLTRTCRKALANARPCDRLEIMSSWRRQFRCMAAVCKSTFRYLDRTHVKTYNWLEHAPQRIDLLLSDEWVQGVIVPFFDDAVRAIPASLMTLSDAVRAESGRNASALSLLPFFDSLSDLLAEERRRLVEIAIGLAPLRLPNLVVLEVCQIELTKLHRASHIVRICSSSIDR